jgi:hypothetical protein
MRRDRGGRGARPFDHGWATAGKAATAVTLSD